MGPGCCGYGMRAYLTRDKKLEVLGGYAESLESELKGVRERMDELKKNN